MTHEYASFTFLIPNNAWKYNQGIGRALNTELTDNKLTLQFKYDVFFLIRCYLIGKNYDKCKRGAL